MFFVEATPPNVLMLEGKKFGNQSVVQCLEASEWLFFPDGTFIFEPGPNADVNSFHILSGRYIPEQEYISFFSHNYLGNSTLSLDGVFHIRQGSIHLEALFSESLLGRPAKVAHIKQQYSLGPWPLEASTGFYAYLQQVKSLKDQDYEERHKDDPEPIYIDPEDESKNPGTAPEFEFMLASKVVEGIPVPSSFKVELTGFVDGKPFETHEVNLGILPVPPSSEAPFTVSITNPEISITPGSLLLLGENEAQGGPSTEFDVRNGKARIRLRAAQISSFTVYDETYHLPTSLVIDDGFLQFQVDEGVLKGEFQASGTAVHPITQNRRKVSYKATLHGKRTDDLDEPIQVYDPNTLTLSGTWDTGDDVLGIVDFTMKGETVTGRQLEPRRGRLRGTLRNGIYEFSWDDDHCTGFGFIRAAGGASTWARMVVNVDWQNQPRAFVTRWTQPQKVQSFSKLDTPEELKDMARQAFNAGDHRKAIALHRASLLSVDELKQLEEQYPEPDVHSRLMNDLMSINYIMQSALRTGDYSVFIETIEHGLQLHRVLGPDISTRNLFLERTRFLTGNLDSSRDFLKSLRDNVSLLAQREPYVGIGISFQPDPAINYVLIETTEKYSPARRAGILPNDLLLEIDDESIENLPLEMVSEKLEGDKETRIKLKVQRGDQTKTFVLEREAIAIADAGKWQAFSSQVEKLAHVQDRLIQASNDQIHRITNRAQSLRPEKEDLFKAWRDSSAELDGFNTMISEELLKLETILQAALANDRNILRQLQELVELQSATQNGLRTANQASIQEKETKFVMALRNDPVHFNTEKMLAIFTYQTAITTIQLSQFLELSKQQLNQAEKSQYYQERFELVLSSMKDYASVQSNWRELIVRDFNKVTAQDLGQPFYRKLVSLFIDMEQFEDALVVSEMAKAQALADFLKHHMSPEEQATFRTPKPSMASIEEVADHKDAAIIEFGFGQAGELFIWFIEPSGKLTLRKTSLDIDRFESRIAAMLKTVEGMRKKRAENPEAFEKSYLIPFYDELLSPVDDLLANLTVERLIVVPQDAIFFVPFSALRKSHETQALADQFEIIISPSVQTLELTRVQKARALKANNTKPLIVGNPNRPKGSNFTALPGAEKEALRIGEIYGSPVLTRKDASKTRVVKQMRDASFIHLATHAKLDNDCTQMPGMVMLADDSDDSTGYLTSLEISKLRISPTLVTLSACDTGRGRISSDGVIGLSRAFISAGAPTVVVSLWPVADNPTGELMVRFYGNLKSGLNNTEALRKAMLETRKDYPHPYHWAPFILIGEP